MKKFRIAFTLILLASLLAALLGLVRVTSAHAASASTGTLSGTAVTVNNGPGDQNDPHVSGSLVSYTDNSTGLYEVRYHNLDTGEDAAIPTNGGQDLLSGISGTTVVYMHSTASGQNIYSYDIGSGNAPVELDPLANDNAIRESPAIGNRTVAWVDYTADPAHSQIVAYNLDTHTIWQLTNDTTLLNLEPAVSADGSVIVWVKCTGSFVGCDTWEAVLSSGGTWSVKQLTSDNASELPHTNGQVVVYDSIRNGEQDIYWQPVGGGAEQHISFAGPDRNPHISSNLIVFDHFDTTASIPNWDVYVYSLATQTLYRVTNTLTNETLSDISLTSDGTARVVWNTLEADYNVYGFIFQAPTADASLTITKLVAGANEKGLAGLAAAFTDADPAGTVSDYSATISWGDGATSTGLVAKNPIGAGFVMAGAHQYAKAGTYTVTLTIDDRGGSSVTATHTLVVP
jgi:Tol biopolymer transport system component